MESLIAGLKMEGIVKWIEWRGLKLKGALYTAVPLFYNPLF